MSEHDYLTGLFNRLYFNQVTSNLETTVGISIALIDLDHFKLVNDTYGHSIGDQVLIQVANTMEIIFSEEVTIARYGGEEFAAIGITKDYYDRAALSCHRSGILCKGLCGHEDSEDILPERQHIDYAAYGRLPQPVIWP